MKRSGGWVTAIHEVLKESQKPLTAIEIAHRATQAGLVTTLSQVPSTAVHTAIRLHRKDGNSCGFTVIEGPSGTHNLYWLVGKVSLNR
jgi:hypothetical protein